MALHLLKGSDELVDMLKISRQSYYLFDRHARVHLPSAASPLDEGLGHSGRTFTYAV